MLLEYLARPEPVPTNPTVMSGRAPQRVLLLVELEQHARSERPVAVSAPEPDVGVGEQVVLEVALEEEALVALGADVGDGARVAEGVGAEDCAAAEVFVALGAGEAARLSRTDVPAGLAAECC